MNFIFCKLQKPQKHESHFLQDKKTQKTCILCFASLQNLKKHVFHFLQAKKDGSVSPAELIFETACQTH